VYFSLFFPLRLVKNHVHCIKKKKKNTHTHTQED